MKGENMKICKSNNSLHKSQSNRLFSSRIHSLLMASWWQRERWH